MHAGFFGWGGPPNVWGYVFWWSGQNFPIGRSPEIRGNFSKCALKLLKIWKIMEKYFRKMQNFYENSFFARLWRKIRIIIYTWAIMVVLGPKSPEARKISIILSKTQLRNFRKFDENFRKFVQKQKNKQNFLLWLGVR